MKKIYMYALAAALALSAGAYLLIDAAVAVPDGLPRWTDANASVWERAAEPGDGVFAGGAGQEPAESGAGFLVRDRQGGEDALPPAAETESRRPGDPYLRAFLKLKRIFE